MAITGSDYPEIRRRINALRGRRDSAPVASMWPQEVRSVLKSYGYRVLHRWVMKKPTVARWLRERENRKQLVVLITTRHFAVVYGNRYIDNHTKEPVFIRQAPFRRARLQGYLLVTSS